MSLAVNIKAWESYGQDKSKKEIDQRQKDKLEGIGTSAPGRA